MTKTKKKKKLKKKEENKERKENKDKNNFLHNIYKSMQPLTFSGGINLKPKTSLSILGMVEKLFDIELSKK